MYCIMTKKAVSCYCTPIWTRAGCGGRCLSLTW